MLIINIYFVKLRLVQNLLWLYERNFKIYFFISYILHKTTYLKSSERWPNMYVVEPQKSYEIYFPSRYNAFLKEEIKQQTKNSTTELELHKNWKKKANPLIYFLLPKITQDGLRPTILFFQLQKNYHIYLLYFLVYRIYSLLAWYWATSNASCSTSQFVEGISVGIGTALKKVFLDLKDGAVVFAVISVKQTQFD